MCVCVHNNINDSFSSWLLGSTVTLVIAQDFCKPGQHVSYGCPENDQLWDVLAEVTFLAVQNCGRKKGRCSSVRWCLITLSMGLFFIIFCLTVLYVIYSAFSKSQQDRAGTTYQEASLNLSLLLEFSLELCVLPLFLKDFFFHYSCFWLYILICN